MHKNYWSVRCSHYLGWPWMSASLSLPLINTSQSSASPFKQEVQMKEGTEQQNVQNVGFGLWTFAAYRLSACGMRRCLCTRGVFTYSSMHMWFVFACLWACVCARMHVWAYVQVGASRSATICARAGSIHTDPSRTHSCLCPIVWFGTS